MPSEILIPVRRRHQTSRANLEVAVTRAQHWGYAENEDLILIRRSSTARRYFSRSDLMEPNSVYTRMLTCELTEITINYQGDDVNTRIRNASINDALFIEGTDYLRVGMGTDVPLTNIGSATGDYATNAHNGLHIVADLSTTNMGHLILEGRSITPNGSHSFANGIGMSDISGVADGKIVEIASYLQEFTFRSLNDDLSVKNVFVEIDNGSFEVNPGLIDYDTVISTDGEQYTIFAEGSVDSVGMGTNTPLLNIGSAAGDLNRTLHRGLHILGDNNDGDHAYCIIEGTGNAGNGNAGDNASHLMFASNNTNQTADTKICEFVAGGGRMRLNSLNDDLTANITNILYINITDGDVGIGSADSPTANSGKVLFMGDNAADPTMGNNSCGFYGKDVAGTVEAFAIDEAGNAAQLTSHDEKKNWISHTYITNGDKRIRKIYQMEKIMNLVLNFLDKSGINTDGLYQEIEELI